MMEKHEIPALHNPAINSGEVRPDQRHVAVPFCFCNPTPVHEILVVNGNPTLPANVIWRHHA